MLRGEAARLERMQLTNPVIVAGSTGTIPATAELIASSSGEGKTATITVQPHLRIVSLKADPESIEPGKKFNISLQLNRDPREDESVVLRGDFKMV